MDAPNAPNPSNPNAQDQFMDAVQDHAAQHQVQGLVAQGPTNNNAQVGQNVPIQPPQQLAPAQPIPTGVLVPGPQVVYQSWVGKKPEFSGKPKEDAESHLLSTRDWMEDHNFPKEVNVRPFCLTLTGRARLWYKSMTGKPCKTNLDGNIPKIGNIPKELFHAWRTFKFDENTDMVDSYILRMSQVAAVLNYGEM